MLEPGITKVEDHLGIDNLYDSVNTPLISFLNNSIKAKELFRNDKEYVVMDGEVLIVDEHTGRILAGRRYNDGLHQAIEAKEGVTVREEYQTLATITLQNYFRLYEKLSGMTGTAMTEASEFDKIYKLGVVPIPTNRPMQRIDNVDLVYRTEEAKYEAVADDIAERHEKGQPILIGTVSVEKSEYLSNLLKKRGIPHTVLNAKQHADEAKVVALAGHKGSVTVATNMAGRGTDIMLGGSVDFLADQELRKQGLDPVEAPEDYDAAWPAMVERIKAQVAAEHDEVRDLGGLYVVGTERHESRRIDNQLRGRSGRQGDPGESRFYLSLQDEMMRLFKSEWVDRILTVLKVPDDVPIDAKRVSNAIAGAQANIESQNFESRKNVLKYDDVMSRQREVIYAERRRVLEGADLGEQIRGFLDDVIAGYVRGATEGYAEDWDLDGLFTALNQLYPVGLTKEGRGQGGRRGRGAQPREARRGPAEGRAGGLRPPRGRDGRGGAARARAPRRPLRARPQVARAPLRDGLPPRGHLPAGLLPARPARGVPARGLRHVRRDDGRHQGGVGRLPVQPPGRGRGRRRRADEVQAQPVAPQVSGVHPADRLRAGGGPRAGCPAAAAAARSTRPPSGPRASTSPTVRRTCPTARRPRTVRPRSTRHRVPRTTRSPVSVATRCAPAARDRSSSAATVPPAAPPAARPWAADPSGTSSTTGRQPPGSAPRDRHALPPVPHDLEACGDRA